MVGDEKRGKESYVKQPGGSTCDNGSSQSGIQAGAIAGGTLGTEPPSALILSEILFSSYSSV